MPSLVEVCKSGFLRSSGVITVCDSVQGKGLCPVGESLSVQGVSVQRGESLLRGGNSVGQSLPVTRESLSIGGPTCPEGSPM